MKPSPLFALDFDGVICDSAIELSISGWRCAQQIWTGLHNTNLPESRLPSKQQIEQFKQVRPMMETGYEAILIMKLLADGLSPDELCKHYAQYTTSLITDNALSIEQLKQAFSQLRDDWISNNQQEWLSKNPLFEHIPEKMKLLRENDWYIITTKQQRYAQYILQANHIELSKERIFSMDSGLNKQQALKKLSAKHPNRTIIFIEDRLPTLTKTQKDTELDHITLQLVNWGYNTPADWKVATMQGISVIDKGTFLNERLESD